MVKNLHLIFLGIGFVGIVYHSIAHANPSTGIFAETAMRVDDATVRRVRDTSNGVVCYVVTNYAYSDAPHGRTVAVDCIKE